MNVKTFLVTACLLGLSVANAVSGAFTVVNVIPNNQSGETDQNSEPSIAVNPGGNQALISAFKGVGVPEPYFITAGSLTKWRLFTSIAHNDTTLDWSPGGALYGAILDLAGNSQIIGDAASLYGPNTDQPWLVVTTVGGRDRKYIGINDGNSTPRNSIVRLFTDSDLGGPVWRNVLVDPGTPLSSGNALLFDGVPVRLAVNGNVVYVAFQRLESMLANGDFVGDIGVCRDVRGGAHNFMDSGKHGRPLTPAAKGITIPEGDEVSGPMATFLGSTNVTIQVGRERLGSDLSIAVDPKDPDKVFVAWAQVNGGLSIHVAESDDGGETWREIHQTPTPSALPALAVAGDSTVGLLFTRVDGAGNMTTRFSQGLGSATTTATLASFPDGNPRKTFFPYIGDYQDLQAVDGGFFGTFSAANDPDPVRFPEGVFFQRNVVVNGALRSNFQLTQKGTLADTNGLGIKWFQIPDTSTNGLDVRTTTPLLLADDFLCNTSGPITYIKIWGSWLSNNVASPFFTLNLWSDVPATATNISHPGTQLWEQFFDRGEYTTNLFADGVNENFYRPDTNANLNMIVGPDTQIWEYTFAIPATNRFNQTNGTIYWLSVRAGGLGGNPAVFGWKTCPTNYNDNAVFGHVNGLFVVQNDWEELIHPINGDSLDLAFAIGVGPTASIDPYFFTTPAVNEPPTNGPPSTFTNLVVPQKWRQLPDVSTNGMDVLATRPRILADDFLCTATGPITQVRIWGSWRNDDNPGTCAIVPTNLPCFCLGLWSDVPADGGFPSHPGDLLCLNCFFTNQYSFRIYTNFGIPGVYTNGIVEEFFDPELDVPIGFDNVIWEYTFDIPTNIACVQTNGTIYWLSVYADCLGTNDFLFGWKTSTNHFKDDAVFNEVDPSGIFPTHDWQPLVRPGTTNSLDLAFAIGTPSNPLTNGVPKWLQRPDATPTGIDVLAGNSVNLAGASIRLVADDFLCNVNGYVTDISIWGSWLNDLIDPNATFFVSFWSDAPAVGRVPSHPADLLWQGTFLVGDYDVTLVASNIFFETFMDPSGPNIRGTDSQVYQYDFHFPPPGAFFQLTNHIYWMSVESCDTHIGLFGWKTCVTNDHFGDDAVWTWRIAPPFWHELFYPPGHPFAPRSVDMAFALRTIPVDPGDPPSFQGNGVIHPSTPPLKLWITQSGNNLIITWTGNGILQSAPALNGPWQDISRATSPYQEAKNASPRLYRLRSH